MSNINIEQQEQLKKGRKFINRLEQIQYQYFNGRPQWTKIEMDNLKLFMAYTYYGSPFSMSGNNEICTNGDLFENYISEIKLCILDMVSIINNNIIKKHVPYIEVGFTFTHSICKKECDVCHQFPNKDVHEWRLLRIKLENTNVAYVDLHHKRTYKDWNDYKDNNNLPEGYLFFPEFGFYDEAKYLIQDLTPCSKEIETIVNTIDLVGRVTNFTSGILMCGGLLFPIMSPVVIPMSLVSSTCSLWDFGRQIHHLTDIFQHNQSLFDKNSSEYWCNLTIAALGVITAPMIGIIKKLEMTNVAFMRGNIGKSLSLIQKGACVMQSSFEVVRIFTKINDNQFTLMDIMLLRLDLFLVLGSLLPIFEIEEILKFIVSTSTTAMVTYRKYLSFPYSISCHINKALCFVQDHITKFINELTKCLCGNLTLDKCLLAWKYFQQYLTMYRKKTSTLTSMQILQHIVNETDIVSQALPHTLVEQSDIKNILCGSKMCKLMEQVNADHAAVRFYVGHILDKAKAIYQLYKNTVSECLAQNLTNIREIDEEFCKMYGLRSCQMIDYLSFAINEASLNVNEYAEAYQVFQSRPENNYNKLMTANGFVGNKSIHVYDVPAPCSNLNANLCKQFAQIFDSQNHEYNAHYQYSNPEPNLSILFSITAFSIRIVFFCIDMSDGLPMLNISFFRDSQSNLL